ncbi:MAG: GNAT family N-acetyltransferase [bacterium]
MQGKIEFRIIHDKDEKFLRHLYATTRAHEFTHSLWSDAEKASFLNSQYDLQDQHYKLTYLKGSFRIITLDSVDIGRLYINRADDHLRIVDLSLLPDYQGRGIGTDILRSLLNEAHGGKVPVKLHVDQSSPALKLYLSHGFKNTGINGYYYALEWNPTDH